jgi:hypothetical protein
MPTRVVTLGSAPQADEGSALALRAGAANIRSLDAGAGAERADGFLGFVGTACRCGWMYEKAYRRKMSLPSVFDF